jgi:G3E family GTPase
MVMFHVVVAALTLLCCAVLCCVCPAIKQVEFANVLVLNKTDLISEAELQKLLALLRTLNPSATILTAMHSSVPVEAVMHTGSFSWEAAQASPGWVQLISRFEQQQQKQQHHGHHEHGHGHNHEHEHGDHHHEHEHVHGHSHEHQHSEATKYGISSFVYYAQRPFHPGRLLDQALSQSWQGVLRSKGFYWLATRHDVMGLWQSAGGAWQGEPR